MCNYHMFARAGNIACDFIIVDKICSIISAFTRKSNYHNKITPNYTDVEQVQFKLNNLKSIYLSGMRPLESVLKELQLYPYEYWAKQVPKLTTDQQVNTTVTY